PPRHPSSPLFPYTTLFRSNVAEFGKQGFFRSPALGQISRHLRKAEELSVQILDCCDHGICPEARAVFANSIALVFEPSLGSSHRSEEHTSELQSRENLVCR